MSSSKSYSAYSAYAYADDKYSDGKYSDGGLPERKDESLSSDIPDDGPALLLMNYDIVFVVSGPEFESTKAHCLFGTG